MNRKPPINVSEDTGPNQGCFRILGRNAFRALALYDCDVSLVEAHTRRAACEVLSALVDSYIVCWFSLDATNK